MSSVYDFTVKDIDGKDFPLAKLKGRCLLIVNTASKCTFAEQFKELEEVYRRYRHRGFLVLAFPSNDFLHQEPLSEPEIKQFVKKNFRCSYLLFSKVRVKGPLAHPLFKWLTNRIENPVFGKLIGWNFEKFLIDRDGMVVDRFESRVRPVSKQLTDAIEDVLNEEHEELGDKGNEEDEQA